MNINLMFIQLREDVIMKQYLWCLLILMSVSVLCNQTTMYALFSDISRETMAISFAVISLFVTATQQLLSKESVKEWVISHRYEIVAIEGILGIVLASYMIVFGINEKTLVARWIINNTFFQMLCIFISFIVEKMKEERGDGASFSVEQERFMAIGGSIGHVITVTTVITLGDDLDVDTIIYVYGFLSCIENIGLWRWMKSHDTEYGNK